MKSTQDSATVCPERLRNVIILGATSGIAIEVERQLARRGGQFLLVARSPQRLSELGPDLLARGAARVLTYAADLGCVQQHAGLLDFVQRSFPVFDTVLLSYGSMHDQKERETFLDILLDELYVNFVSASALLTWFAANLEERRTGCLAAITSVAGDCGRRSNYTYGSAKGALALFLQGLRSRLHPAGVKVITIKPGPVRTPMTDDLPMSSHFAPPEVVAHDIVSALDRGAPDVLYTPWFWKPIMIILRHIPEGILKRISF